MTPPVCPNCGKGWMDPFWDDEKNEVYHRCPVCGYGARPRKPRTGEGG